MSSDDFFGQLIRGARFSSDQLNSSKSETQKDNQQGKVARKKLPSFFKDEVEKGLKVFVYLSIYCHNGIIISNTFFNV